MINIPSQVLVTVFIRDHVSLKTYEEVPVGVHRLLHQMCEKRPLVSRGHLIRAADYLADSMYKPSLELQTAGVVFGLQFLKPRPHA
uniref:SFRICE_024795 n=1 Tax=Spodoptera frugiperda TaxID=7108 RepID=A0A2H1WPI5_SPOFR